ncbi:hypothetical protein HOU03_gp293 [Caulobacter phage CcrSC]|uniref:Uncharacterized protein n=1 Tax=Caulobacter phage CcrSC TaxID=2283272 RepID=A0A385EFW6_9CAUD|nr:hypothetical protein HOU03_gp293 [Caulobacter phage CcrSC]AXQ69975.1 hypothetical protein CcrSC_gp393 [Caulobacter phage CcrSC]
MPKKIHTVTFADGATATRESENRTYSHVVVGKHDKRVDIDYARKRARSDRSNYDYYKNMANAQPGVPSTYTSHSDDRPFTFTYTAAEIAKGQEEIAGRDPETYCKDKLAERLDEIEKKAAEGYYDRWNALTWASRADLAAKQVNNWSKTFTEVTILPVEHREAAPRKKKEA